MAVPNSKASAELKNPGKTKKPHVQRDKMAEHGMAGCFTLGRRITRLKCVNSEIRSPAFTPKRVPSFRSSHGDHTRQELDHLSDRLGTESL